MSDNENKCWICGKIDKRTSLLPKHFGSHCEDYEEKWEKATNKRFGNKKVVNHVTIYDFTDEMCAPICFDCAH